MSHHYEKALTEAANRLGAPAFIEGESFPERNKRIHSEARRRDRKLLRSLKRDFSHYLDRLMP